MKKLIAVLILNLTLAGSAHAEVLSAQEANAICHTKALKAAHFLSESRRKFIITYTAGDIAEISTPITYEFRYTRSTEALYTVVAYAYPDTRTCTIGSATNNIAGND